MTPTIVKCFSCKNRINLYKYPSTCKAFPNGIPDDVYFGEKEHKKPLPNQGNDIVFEEKKEQTKI